MELLLLERSFKDKWQYVITSSWERKESSNTMSGGALGSPESEKLFLWASYEKRGIGRSSVSCM